MPFKSEKQRRWMHKNKPKMAEEWEKKYHGKKGRKKSRKKNSKKSRS